MRWRRSFSFHGPPFGIGAIGYRHNQAPGDTGLPGYLKLGGFELGGRVKESGSERKSSGRHGIYVVGDHALLRFGPPSANRTAGVFRSLVVALDESVSPMSWYFSAGVVGWGQAASRPTDSLSIGLAYGAYVVAAGSERAGELVRVMGKTAATEGLDFEDSHDRADQ